MNKNIKLAVAGAVLALSATAANAGIIIPAGDWTVDIGGNVNMFSTWAKADGRATITGGAVAVGTGTNSSANMSTGLLPNFLSVGGTTRQNDLDVSFAISIQPGASVQGPLEAAVGGFNANANNINNRQAFITFGDKSWGSVKVGKDIGIFASDAILSDMTLLGVGYTSGGPAAGGNTTLGRIGYGYLYADWKPQIAYTTPNFNGFQATAGITQNFVVTTSASTNGLGTTTEKPASPAYEGKISYSFAANDVTGKIWASGIANKIGATTVALEDKVIYAGDVGANISVAGFGLTGYYYDGSGIGITGQNLEGVNLQGKLRDSNGGYVQATYALPTKTKLGVSWGISNLDAANATDSASTLVKENEMWTAGLYHPLTKHLNLVAEFSHATSRSQVGTGGENKVDAGSLGAILFF